jgi:8-oxo-dGTP pyrophosphatase MutT (NUDIX family)
MEGSPAAVLALFAPGEVLGEYSLLLIRRADALEKHSGQMAFPGGKADPEDLDLEKTALREAREEVGLNHSSLEILGHLPALWTVTGFWVTPVVAFSRVPSAEIELEANPAEIADILWVPWKRLRDPAYYRTERRLFRGLYYPVHVFEIGDEQHRVWGATGSMIKNLLDRMQTLS